jgi:type IV pilus assembly protein PilA
MIKIMIKLIKAFSLTELMVVVAIAAFIAAVAVPNYKSYLNKAKVTDMIATIEPCKIQVYQTFLQTGTFPATISCHSKTLNNTMSAAPLINGIYASYTVDGSNNYVEFALKSDVKADSGEDANLYIRLTQSNGDLTYSCGILGNTANTVPIKYLPAGCNTQ